MMWLIASEATIVKPTQASGWRQINEEQQCPRRRLTFTAVLNSEALTV